MGKVVKKALKVTNKLTGGILGGVADNFLGTDIGGFKAAQKEAQRQEAERNQAALSAQLNANTIGALGTENIVNVEAGGSAADATMSTDTKKRRAATISSTLGI